MSLIKILNVLLVTVLLLFVESGMLSISYCQAADKDVSSPEEKKAVTVKPLDTSAPKITRKSVKISAVGDCTIGWDDRFNWGNTLITAIFWPGCGKFFGKMILP